MATPANLSSLHDHEEEIRINSLKLIDDNCDLREHLSMIEGAMDIIYAMAHDHANATDDELTVQYLGLRLFNSAASSLKLGISGYYQSAFGLVRDVFETVELLDYMRSNPNQIAAWKATDERQRIATFGPGAIRNVLNERDQFPGNKRKEEYGRLSEYATHATAPGFQLLAREGLGRIGPFLDERYLKAWIEEAVKRLVYGAVIFMAHFRNVELPILSKKGQFLNHANRWRERYIRLREEPVQPNPSM